MSEQGDTQPVEQAVEATGKSPLRVVGIVLLVAALVLDAWVLVNRVNGASWDNKDTILVAVATVFMIACIVIWWGPISAALSTRGVQLQANATLVTIVVLGILILVNIIVDRRLSHIKADWTKGQFWSLSAQSQQVVKSITKDNPVEILGLIPGGQLADPRAREMQSLRLQEYGRLSPHVTIKIMDPLMQPAGAKAAQDAGLTRYPGVVVRFKDDTTRAEAVSGVEEADITKGLLKLLDTSPRKVYFLTGHGEPSSTGYDNDGLGKFKTMLTDDRYEVAELDLRSKTAVPDDASCLVAVWPKYPYQEDELQKLSAYLSGGGRMLACLDPEKEANLSQLFEPYGIEWHGETVNDSVNTHSGDPRYYGAGTYSDHEAVEYQKMWRTPVAFIISGYLTKGTVGDEYEVDEVLKTSGSAYAGKPAPEPAEGETAAASTRVNGPLTVIMTATTKDSENEDEDKDKKKDDEGQGDQAEKPRIRVAVVADGEFPINYWERRWPPNLEVASNLVAWLTDNAKVIGIRPKNAYDELEKHRINIDQKGRRWVFLLTFVLPLLLVLVAGVTVQIMRR